MFPSLQGWGLRAKAGRGLLGRRAGLRVETLEPRQLLAALVGPASLTRGYSASYRAEIPGDVQPPVSTSGLGNITFQPLVIEALQDQRDLEVSGHTLYAAGAQSGRAAYTANNLLTRTAGSKVYLPSLAEQAGLVNASQGGIITRINAVTEVQFTGGLRTDDAANSTLIEAFVSTPTGQAIGLGWSNPNFPGSTAFGFAGSGRVVGNNPTRAAIFSAGQAVEIPSLAGVNITTALSGTHSGSFLVGHAGPSAAAWRALDIPTLQYELLNLTWDIPAGAIGPEIFRHVVEIPGLGPVAFGEYTDGDTFEPMAAAWRLTDGVMVAGFGPGSVRDVVLAGDAAFVQIAGAVDQVCLLNSAGVTDYRLAERLAGFSYSDLEGLNGGLSYAAGTLYVGLQGTTATGSEHFIVGFAVLTDPPPPGLGDVTFERLVLNGLPDHRDFEVSGNSLYLAGSANNRAAYTETNLLSRSSGPIQYLPSLAEQAGLVNASQGGLILRIRIDAGVDFIGSSFTDDTQHPSAGEAFVAGPGESSTGLGWASPLFVGSDGFGFAGSEIVLGRTSSRAGAFRGGVAIELPSLAATLTTAVMGTSSGSYLVGAAGPSAAAWRALDVPTLQFELLNLTWEVPNGDFTPEFFFHVLELPGLGPIAFGVYSDGDTFEPIAAAWSLLDGSLVATFGPGSVKDAVLVGNAAFVQIAGVEDKISVLTAAGVTHYLLAEKLVGLPYADIEGLNGGLSYANDTLYVGLRGELGSGSEDFVVGFAVQGGGSSPPTEYVYEFDFDGNGTADQTLTAGLEAEAAWTYVQSGTYTIRAVATPVGGGPAVVFLKDVTVSGANVVTTAQGQRLLQVGGTEAADLIRVQPLNATTLVVMQGAVRQDFTNIQHVEIRGLEGADRIIYTATLPVVIEAGGGHDLVISVGGPRATVSGGDGNDNLTVSATQAVLFGGLGNDSLVSLGERNVLVGGAGSDLFLGASPRTVFYTGDVNFTPTSPVVDQLFTELGLAAPREQELRTIGGLGLDDEDVDYVLGFSFSFGWWNPQRDLVTGFGIKRL